MPVTVNIPDAVWERHEPEIRSFYPPRRKKAMKLSFVMKRMEKKYGLCATVSQWKTRLDKWRLTKNREPKTKAHVLDLIDSPTTACKTRSRYRKQTSVQNTCAAQVESQISLSASRYTSRFVTADFEHQLYNNLSAPAQALFNRIQSFRPNLTVVSVGTTTMTEALFLLQRLNTNMQQVNRNQFKDYVRHLDIIRQNASISIAQDGIAFVYLAAFFLKIDTVSSHSGPGVLPIVIGCLHGTCEKRLGYEHRVTTLIRSLSLSAMFRGKPVRDVSPLEWKTLRAMQVIALIAWLKTGDEQYPTGRQRLRVWNGLNDLLNICGMPALRDNTRWGRLLGKKQEFEFEVEAEIFEIASKVLDDMGVHLWTNPPCNSRLSDVLWGSLSAFEFNNYFSHFRSATLDALNYEPKQHISQRFLFTIDESINGKISGQICHANQCRFIEVSGYNLSRGRSFKVSLNMIIQPNPIFHAGNCEANISLRTSASEQSIGSRLWFSLVEYICGLRCKDLRRLEDFRQDEHRRFDAGWIYMKECWTNFTCENIFTYNLYDLWAILFDFMGASNGETVAPLPHWLDVVLFPSIYYRPLEYANPPQGRSMLPEARITFKDPNLVITKHYDGAISRHPRTR